MSNKNLIIEERAASIGNFLVGRLLPFRRKRMVGPFIFVDHMGPATIGSGNYMYVGQHPHIGLSTLTYLYEGEILHQDSIGTSQLIKAGAVNWMTAGSAVVHTEQTPEQLKDGKEHQVHGYQIWVALPKELEDMAPEFHHIPQEDLPVWEEDGVLYTLIAGKAYQRESPVPVQSELFMLRLDTAIDTDLHTGDNVYGEIGICVVEGYVEVNRHRFGKGNLLVSNAIDQCGFKIYKDSSVLLFGGYPFEEERYIDWNFVSSDREKIEAAKQRWQNREFKMVEGDDSYVPLPIR